jgi:hypothetical protein
MTVAPPYQADVEAILATRRGNGADFWATPDGRLSKGGPFSTLEAPALLTEPGVDSSDEAVHGAAQLLLGSWREDGHFRLSPSDAIYPCHTIYSARACLLGHASDERLHRTFEHLVATLHDDGGWRWNSWSFSPGFKPLLPHRSHCRCLADGRPVLECGASV